jgi:anti-sigma B factor antagonist
MEITIHEYHVHVDIIEITGRLEAFTVKDLRSEQDNLIDKGGKNFVVNLSTTAFMDSAGMSALVSLLKRARQAGGDVVLVKPTDPAAYRILTLTRFDQVFQIVETVDEAIKLF